MTAVSSTTESPNASEEPVNKPALVQRKTTERLSLQDVEADLTSDGDLDMTPSQLFKIIDTDGDGAISLEEFERLHKTIADAALIQEAKRQASALHFFEASQRNSGAKKSIGRARPVHRGFAYRNAISEF